MLNLRAWQAILCAPHLIEDLSSHDADIVGGSRTSTSTHLHNREKTEEVGSHSEFTRNTSTGWPASDAGLQVSSQFTARSF